MNRKIGLLLILILGILSIMAIVYYVFYFSLAREKQTVRRQNINTPKATSTLETKNNLENVPINIKKPVVKKDNTPLGQESLERIARSFAERFGSFSNQSNFSNISDLKMVMSEKMQSWADSYMLKHKKSNVSQDVYYGMTTKALSTVVQDFDDVSGTAKIMVETRRREAVGTTNNASKLYNQKILITFVKENQAWKVDSAYWQN